MEGPKAFCRFDAKRLAGIATATLVRGSDRRSPSGGTPDPIAGRRKAASKGVVAIQLLVNRGAPVWVRPDPAFAGSNRSSGPILGSNGRESLRAPAFAAGAPAGDDERPEIVPVAGVQRRTPRAWRSWGSAKNAAPVARLVAGAVRFDACQIAQTPTASQGGAERFRV